MIFKEQDCTNVAENKKAIQSSISQHSNIDDASRVLRSDLEVDDFAMHTGWEENPWWLLDLEVETPIDCVRITNRSNKAYQEDLKNVKIELSADKQTWFLVDSSCFEWKNGLDILDANIYQAMNARYIKISLQGKGHLVLKKVEVFVRKVKGYVIAARPDGLGMRIGSMIYGAWLAEKIGFKFCFAWRDDTDIDHLGIAEPIKNISMSGEIFKHDEAFDEKYLKEHYLEDYSIFNYGGIYVHSKEDLEGLKTRPIKWGYFIGLDFIQCIEKLGYLNETKKAYESIGWSTGVKAILSSVETQAKRLKKFVAIHLRGADAVFGKLKIAPDTFIYARHFPYEVALDIIIKEMKQGNDVVIFGQDFEGNKNFAHYIKSLNIQGAEVACVDDCLDRLYDNKERSFFEINLMSKASKIYATGHSEFSRTALGIAGKNMLVSFYDIYTTQELFDIMLKNINVLKLHPLEKAYSWYRIYDFSKQLKLNLNETLRYAKKALACDEDNDAFRIAIIDCLFKMQKYDEVENLLKDIVNIRLNKFKAALYGPHTVFWWSREFYNDIYQKYLNFENKQNYPYISFIAALISYSNKFNDSQNGRKYLQYTLEKEPKNEVFLSFLKELKMGAKYRVRSHLAYKLGRALIAQSKTFKDRVLLPFTLGKIVKQHRKEQKLYDQLVKQDPSLALPLLETYVDYLEALKEKECLTYKLGASLIQASKTWYKGGYIKFYFDVKNLKKQFKINKNA